MAELINSFPDFSGAFGDKRLDKRASQVLHKLTSGRSSSLRYIAETESEQRSFYRLFNNESFTEQAIEGSIINRCSELCRGRHVLAIQDTVEYNLTANSGRIKAGSGLGRTGQNDVLGFLMHHSMVVDAHMGTAVGFSSIKLWERDQESPDKHTRKYYNQPIEEKESYKWIEASLKTRQLLTDAESITIVADRESDMYDMLALIPDEKTHLVLRCKANRNLSSGQKLYEYLNALPVMHTYDLPIIGDSRKGNKKRIAKMKVRWNKISLPRPNNSNKDLPDAVDMYVVEAKEAGKTNGIIWRLFTTHPVDSPEDAMQIIEWYKQRWFIEQVHRLLKTDGFRIERSQLEQGWAIRKLTLLAMMAVLRILQMMLAYEEDTEQPIGEAFDEEQQRCLSMLNEKLEGQTEKQSNPAKPGTMKWATWIIARLGGWKGYTSQRKPGPIVLHKGLAKFYNIFEGWQLYQTSSKDVYTP